MSIDAKLDKLHRQVKIINKGDDSDTMVAELQILIDDLNPLVVRLKETKKCADLFLNEGVDITIESELQDKIIKSNSTVKSILVKFKKDLDPTKIKSNCKRFTDGFGNIIDGLNDAFLGSWRAFLQEGRVFRDPADFSADLAQNNQDNRQYLSEYKQKSNDFISVNLKVPQTSEELQRVKLLAESLNEIYVKFKFDERPESVNIFLRKVSERDGARLDLLTDEVLDYIKRTNTISNYAVKKGFFY